MARMVKKLDKKTLKGYQKMLRKLWPGFKDILLNPKTKI